MSEPQRRGRLFRDTSTGDSGFRSQQPFSEKSDEPPEKPEQQEQKPPPRPRKQRKKKLVEAGIPISSEERPTPSPQKAVERPTPFPQTALERPTLSSQKAEETFSRYSNQENARQTAREMDSETKKHFSLLGKWMEFYGFEKTADGRKKVDIDLYRDTPVRLLGYSEEIGEALRPFMPKLFVRGGYLVTSIYILADTMDKTVKTSEARWETKKVRQREIEKTLIDTIMWQGLASVVIPGVIINRSVYIILYVMGLRKQLPKSVRSLTTASICLALIPTIVKPVDTFVDYFLDNTLRRMLKRRQPPGYQ